MSHIPISQQELYYAELRLGRLMKQYTESAWYMKGFIHSSIGIALVEKMEKLDKLINS